MRVQHDLVEEPAVAVLGIHGQIGAEDAQAVSEVHVAAVLAAIAAHLGETIAESRTSW